MAEILAAGKKGTALGGGNPQQSKKIELLIIDALVLCLHIFFKRMQNVEHANRYK
jgi:hypothetical protein